MTVAAYRDGWIACDSLASHNDAIHTTSEVKIRRIGEMLVAMSGNVPSWQSIEEWFASSQPRERFADYEFDLMIITPDCRIWVVDQRGIVDEIKEPYWAIGCGAASAICVMDCGHSARQAVASAIKRVPGCGGKIHQLRLL